MSVFGPKTIRNKLMLMILSTTLIALFFFSIALIFLDQQSTARAMEQRLSILIRIIADRSTAAIAFDDRLAASQILSALKQDDAIVVACTFGDQNKLFSEFGKNQNLSCGEIFHHSLDGKINYLPDGYLQLTHGISLKQKTIGYITIVSSTKELHDRLLLIINIILLLILIVLLATYLLARNLQKYITVPLLKLRDITDHISLHNNYTARLPAADKDEIGALYNSFSRMMTQIQQRDDEREKVEETLRASKNHYQTLIQNVPFCIQEIDLQGRILSMNASGLEMMAVADESTICGVPYLDGVVEKDKSNVTKLLKLALIGTASFFEFDATIGSGVTRSFSSSFVPIKDKNQQVIRLMGITSDITEQKTIELSLRRSQKMDAVGQLTGGIAHDFNNILGIINGNIELLEYDLGANEKHSRRFRAIRQSSDRAVKLTRQLLGFSRTQVTEAKVTNVNVLIEHLFELITRSITPRIEVIRSFEPELWNVEINRGDFEDVLLNLVLNARDAMENKGTIRLVTSNCYLDESFCSAHVDANVGRYVRLSITDDGAGISSEVQEHMFEPFFTTKERGKGTGLGLAMVFGFVKRSKGFLFIDSEVGKGTCVNVYLPRGGSGKGECEQPEDLCAAMAVRQGEELILVVDDEVGLLDLAEETLKKQGYEVVTATNGNEALERLQEHTDIDFLFSDVVMPGGINGYQLAEKALDISSSLKVLLTSGFTSTKGLPEKTTRTNFELLQKPYSQIDMLKHIGDMLPSKRKDNDPTQR